MQEPDEKAASRGSDSNNGDCCRDDETVEEPPPTAQLPLELTTKSQTSTRTQSSSSSSLPENVKEQPKALTENARNRVVHVYPSGASGNNFSAAERFAPASAGLSSNHQESRSPGLWIDTAAGWSVDGLDVPTRPSLAHANQSFRSIDESAIRPPQTVSSLSSRSFFSRHRRLMQEEAVRQREDQIIRQHIANDRGERQIVNPDHFQDGAYITVATPVPINEENNAENGASNKKGAACNWRVMLVTLVLATAAVIGMGITVVLKNRKGSDPDELNTKSILDERQNHHADATVVPMPPFSMQMATDGSIDQDVLISATVSHLSAPMQEEIENFEGLELNITIREDQPNIHSGNYPKPRVRGRSDSFFAVFDGIVKLKEGSVIPDQTDIDSIIIDAFSAPDLEDYTTALEDMGVFPVSLVVSDKYGIIIGTSTQGEYVTHPTPLPTATDDLERDTPTEFPTTSRPTSLPLEDAEPTSPIFLFTAPSTMPPTPHPSDLPTVETIEALTEAPTRAPSFVPTTTPTAPPSKAPTFLPTQVPTSAPTIAPTPYPTAEPTLSPTYSPTSAPTISPTPYPTAEPTLSPTHSPSFAPTSRLPISFKIESQPGFLTTTMENKFSRSGAMFDVKAKGSALTITSIDVHIESTEANIPVEVWTGRSTYIGFEKYSRVWTQLNGGRPYNIPRGFGQGRLTPIPENVFNPIIIPPGSSLGIYVTLQARTGMLFGNGAYVSEDDHLRIESGASVGFRFDTPLNRDRAWSGAIRYAVE